MFTTKQYPQVPYPNIFWKLPGMVITSLSWTACSNAWPSFQKKKYFPVFLWWNLGSFPLVLSLVTQEKRTDPHLSSASFRVVMDRVKVFPETPFLQAKHPSTSSTPHMLYSSDSFPALLPLPGPSPVPQCLY